jgi:hypothetical protein
MTFPKPTECRGQEQSQDSLSIAPEPYKFSQLFLAWREVALAKQHFSLALAQRGLKKAEPQEGGAG